jgi:hypothetical protein
VPGVGQAHLLIVGGKPGEDGHDADRSERHVDQERQAPAADRDEQAAERRADRHGDLSRDGQRAEHAARRLRVKPPGLRFCAIARPRL